MPTALVTGATAGLGAEFARQLAARGQDLVLVARDAARLEQVAEELRAHLPGDGRGDHRRPGRPRPGRPHRRAALPTPSVRCDTLVNNAGFARGSSFLADLAEEERAVEVMLHAVLVLSHAAATAMKARGRGVDRQRRFGGGLRGHGQLLGHQVLGRGLLRGPFPRAGRHGSHRLCGLPGIRAHGVPSAGRAEHEPAPGVGLAHHRAGRARLARRRRARPGRRRAQSAIRRHWSRSCATLRAVWSVRCRPGWRRAGARTRPEPITLGR